MTAGQAGASLFNASEYLLDRQIQAGRGDRLALTGTVGDLSYGELGGYVTAHEISIDGPMREYYLCGLADTPDQAKWRTEIGWPIFRADGPA